MNVEYQLVGLTQLQVRLETVPKSVWGQIVAAMNAIVVTLQAGVLDRMAALFKDGGGKMRDSLATSVYADDDRVTGNVMAFGLPYLAIQEFGGVTRPHDIFPVNAQVLAFMMPGAMQFKGSAESETVFARVVHHPGSVMPERSYMRSALAMERADIVASLTDAATQGVAGTA